MAGAGGRDPLGEFQIGEPIGRSDWIKVSQGMIDGFGESTLDPDPMHIDPDWARRNGPFGGTIAFGFLTMSLLTRLLYSAVGTDSDRDPASQGYHLNYGFDRLRLVSPVPVDGRVRGAFVLKDRRRDEKARWVTTVDCTVEVEGAARPALVADWLSIWVPPAT
jgi:acyl dehydratase